MFGLITWLMLFISGIVVYRIIHLYHLNNSGRKKPIIGWNA